MRRVASVLTVVILGCTSGTPSASPTPPAVKSAAPATPCDDRAPAINVSAVHTTTDLAQVPGRVLFWDAGRLRLLEDGRVTELATPHPATAWSSRLMPDGRVVAMLTGARKGEGFLWEHRPGHEDRLIAVPISADEHENEVMWSPDASRAAWWRFGGDIAVTIGLDGATYRTGFPDEAVYTAAWRGQDELTVVSAPATNEAWPITGATLWSWRPPAAPVSFGGPMTLAAPPAWSADGRHLAALEVTATGRDVVLYGPTSRRLLSQTDLSSGPGGCVRQVLFTGVGWAPDSRTVAVLTRASAYAVAFVRIDPGTRPSLFVAPVGAGTCYIPGQIGWHDAAAVVPLFGPDCGSNAAERRENALALVDPATGALIRYVAMSRKGLLGASGGWAATSSPLGDHATEFIELNTDRRITVQLRRVVDHCCVP